MLMFLSLAASENPLNSFLAFSKLAQAMSRILFVCSVVFGIPRCCRKVGIKSLVYVVKNCRKLSFNNAEPHRQPGNQISLTFSHPNSATDHRHGRLLSF